MKLNAVKLRGMVKRAFNVFGIDVRLSSRVQRNYHAEHLAAWRESWKAAACLGVRTVLDIGANTGQFLEMIRPVVPLARAVCFEPIPACFAELKARAQGMEAVECHNVGLGAVNEERVMNVSSSTPSSSFLKMLPFHKEEWPASAGEVPCRVRVRRLDDVVAGQTLDEPMAAKIDVQGFEREVILGGVDTLGRCIMVVVEVSFYPLYEGQPLFADVHDAMRELGFRYGGALQSHRHKSNGTVIQEDALFLKEAAWRGLAAG
jgi:FkbM family methyltransferase